jgi:molecular chaperone HtpG
MSHGDFEIRITPDKENRTLTISDNGIGMTKEELEANLGTIAKSGSLAFKQENADAKDIDVIGQFGVGFYSAFMVSDCVTVESRAYGESEAYRWQSKGVEGYTVEECDKPDVGTTITLHIKDDTDEEKYSQFLEEYTIKTIVKKYSDYVRYPIRMTVEKRRLKEGTEDEYETVKEDETLNSMIPLWKKNKKEIKPEEYEAFYKDKFMDYEKPLKVIHYKTEGQATYDALLFIPSHAPFDYYTKEYEKGLQLYSKGVLIMDKCKDLLPDHFSFVKGLVDSEDLSLNISREVLQHDHQLKLIAKTIEKKIDSELKKMLETDREAYEKFFKAFGMQIKFGVYSDYGIHKDSLKDLLLFYSSSEKKPVTLKEYVSRMKDGQKDIYYAAGETTDKIDMLPQVDSVKDKGYEILYLTDYVDEFALRALSEYDGKTFVNVCTEDVDLGTEEEKEALKKENEDNADMLKEMKEALGENVHEVRFTDKLKDHPVCLSSEGAISLEMQKVLNAMPDGKDAKATVVLEINANHPIAEKLKSLYKDNKDSLCGYAKILYAQARLIGGMSVDDPVELSNLVCNLMTK